MGLLIKEDRFIGSLFKKIRTETDVEDDVRKLIDESISLIGKKCEKCGLYEKGCENQEYEAIEGILAVIKEKYKEEIVLNYRKMKNIQPHSIITIAEGISMIPVINQGDILIIREFINLKKGDIINFFCNKQFVIHRIVGFDGDFVVTSGDNCDGQTERVFSRNVVGVVSKIIKKEENKELFDLLYKSIGEMKNDKI